MHAYERNCVNSWILLADFESALMYFCKYLVDSVRFIGKVIRGNSEQTCKFFAHKNISQSVIQSHMQNYIPQPPVRVQSTLEKIEPLRLSSRAKQVNLVQYCAIRVILNSP